MSAVNSMCIVLQSHNPANSLVQVNGSLGGHCSTLQLINSGTCCMQDATGLLHMNLDMPKKWSIPEGRVNPKKCVIAKIH